MVVFPLTPPGVVYANFQPIKMPNPLAQSVNNNYNNLTRASSFSSRPPVGVASQMLHEQDAIVEDTVYGRSYWLARIASVLQYKLSVLEWQHQLS